MTTLTLTITLPDALAREAETRGLLTPEKVAALISAELERIAQSERFAAVAATLRAIPPEGPDDLTEADIAEEVRLVRAERKARCARHS